MGIFGKFKNIFYDTVEEEDEIETKPVEEIKKPKIEELKLEDTKEEIKPKVVEKEPVIQKSDNTFSERELFKPEKTFNFTEFDDEEEEEIKPRVNVMELERNNRNNSKTNIKNINLDLNSAPETPKVFKPSPVISPIYGILDKDYKKEEIRQKSIEKSTNTSQTITSYDTVRKKAYGNLEDTFEDSLVTVTTTDITAVVKEIDNDVDKLEKTQKLEELISEIEKNAELTVGDLEEAEAEKAYETEEIKITNSSNNINNKPDEDENDERDYNDRTMTDNTLEHDLFNLIDSMYDDKED